MLSTGNLAFGASKVIVVEEDSIIPNLLKSAQSLTAIYKHLSLYPQIDVLFIPQPHQRNFYLQQMETTREKQNQSRCRFVESDI